MPTYNAYGLTISSDIALPALNRVELPQWSGLADILIKQDTVIQDGGGKNAFSNWNAGPGRFLGEFFDTGRFLVTGGNLVRYQRADNADDTHIVSILLGTCLAAALMQRHILPIHACCVLTDKGAIMVMGRSGAGKSTTLGGLLELGMPMMADDVTGLSLANDGAAIAIPAFPSIRLWKDSLKTLGHNPEGLARVHSDLEKYYLPSGDFHNQSEPIRGIAYISASNSAELRCDPISPAHKVETLSRFIFRKNFIDGMELRRIAFQTVAATVRDLPMVRIIRPAGATPPSEVAARILDSIKSLEAEKLRETVI